MSQNNLFPLSLFLHRKIASNRIGFHSDTSIENKVRLKKKRIFPNKTRRQLLSYKVVNP